MRDSGNQYLFIPHEIGDKARKNRAVQSPITSRALPPEKRVSHDAPDNVRNFNPETHTQAGFFGFIALRGFPELRLSLGKKLIS